MSLTTDNCGFLL